MPHSYFISICQLIMYVLCFNSLLLYLLCPCSYMSTYGNKRVELFDMGIGASEPTAEENVLVASGVIIDSAFSFLVITCDDT